MVMAKAEESAELKERHLHVVGSLEVPSIDAQHMPLHLIAGAQDNHLGQAVGYLI
jgi:sortase (surface protein transpeptidase)